MSFPFEDEAPGDADDAVGLHETRRSIKGAHHDIVPRSARGGRGEDVHSGLVAAVADSYADGDVGGLTRHPRVTDQLVAFARFTGARLGGDAISSLVLAALHFGAKLDPCGLCRVRRPAEASPTLPRQCGGSRSPRGPSAMRCSGSRRALAAAADADLYRSDASGGNEPSHRMQFVRA